MMRKSLPTFLFLAVLLAISAAHAASVHLRPNPDSPVLGQLSQEDLQFASPGKADLSAEQKKAGWQAIAYFDSFDGFVRRTDITKDLLVAPGAPVYLSEKADKEQILTHASADDVFDIGRVTDDWAEVSFRKAITGFVRPDNSSAPATSQRATEPQVFQEEPTAPVFEDIQNPPPESSRAKTISNRAAIPGDGIMRLYEGRLQKSRSFLFTQPPYPYQVIDSSGNRIAYVDLHKLLITTPIDRFLDRTFLFYGQAEPIEGRRDFVIRVEHMRLK
jgi:hypothetical protein